MKSSTDWVRRGQRVIRMVSELHRMGYQRLRIMPYLHPNAWRLAIGPAEVFSNKNGAVIPLSGEWSTAAVYSAASGNAYFDWEDAKGDDARKLADKFITRFPDVANRGRGRDWAYAGWLAELIGYLEGGEWIPVTYWEYMKGEPQDLTWLPIWTVGESNKEWTENGTVPGPGVKRFPLPPMANEGR